jgi:hypothetical protein
LLKILLEENTIGTVKSTVLNRYNQFKFKTLAKSVNIPGFVFIANTNTISTKEIQKIEKAILKLNPLGNAKDQDIVSKWSENTKYGAVKTEKNIYDTVIESTKQIIIPKEKR